MEASPLHQLSARLRYHYGLAVDKLPEATRLRLFVEMTWVEEQEAKRPQP